MGVGAGAGRLPRRPSTTLSTGLSTLVLPLTVTGYCQATSNTKAFFGAEKKKVQKDFFLN